MTARTVAIVEWEPINQEWARFYSNGEMAY